MYYGEYKLQMIAKLRVSEQYAQKYPGLNPEVDMFNFVSACLGDDNSFFGYAIDGAKTDDVENYGVSHYVVGVYKKNLGLTIVKFPFSEGYAPMVIRCIPDEKGKLIGDMYLVQNYKIMYALDGIGKLGEQNKIGYEYIGSAEVDVKRRNMEIFDNYYFDEWKKAGIDAIDDQFSLESLSRYHDTMHKQCVDDIVTDLIDYYEHEKHDIYMEK